MNNGNDINEEEDENLYCFKKAKAQIFHTTYSMFHSWFETFKTIVTAQYWYACTISKWQVGNK